LALNLLVVVPILLLVVIQYIHLLAMALLLQTQHLAKPFQSTNYTK
jgi:hypothetical protein